MNLISQLGMTPYRQDENEEYMNENQLSHFRNLLNAWKTHLLNTSEITEDQIQDDATKIPDSNDRASYESNLGFLLKKSGRERKLVVRIEKSIAGIEKKTYGYCRSCSSVIGLKRLEARPVAKFFVDAILIWS